jgi:hypothetical protein
LKVTPPTFIVASFIVKVPVSGFQSISMMLLATGW